MRRLAWGPGLALALALVLALGGCGPEAEGNETGLCTVVCQCMAGGLPSQQRECVAECSADPDVRQVSNACVECVYLNADSCSNLFEECFFGGVCTDSQPVPEPDPLPPGTPDAGFADAL